MAKNSKKININKKYKENNKNGDQQIMHKLHISWNYAGKITKLFKNKNVKIVSKPKSTIYKLLQTN